MTDDRSWEWSNDVSWARERPDLLRDALWPDLDTDSVRRLADQVESPATARFLRHVADHFDVNPGGDPLPSVTPTAPSLPWWARLFGRRQRAEAHPVTWTCPCGRRHVCVRPPAREWCTCGLSIPRDPTKVSH